MEPGEEAERPASTEISLLSKWYKQTAKWSHHGANPAAVLRQEIWDVASPGDSAPPSIIQMTVLYFPARAGLRLL